MLHQFYLSTQRAGQCHGWHLGPGRKLVEVSHKLTGSSLAIPPQLYFVGVLFCVVKNKHMWYKLRVYFSRVQREGMTFVCFFLLFGNSFLLLFFFSPSSKRTIMTLERKMERRTLTNQNTENITIVPQAI